jgi:hypothetical protein
MLFRPENDYLLFAYFNISLKTRRRSRLQAIRTQLIIKRRLLRAFKVDEIGSMFWNEMLVRDIDDDRYPYSEEVPGFADMEFRPWEVVDAVAFETDGILVARNFVDAWVRPDGSWDVIESSAHRVSGSMGSQWNWNFEAHETRKRDSRTLKISTKESPLTGDLWLLPFGNILEVDKDGDPTYEGIHTYCAFTGPNGPYAGRSTWYVRAGVGARYIHERDGPQRARALLPALGLAGGRRQGLG